MIVLDFETNTFTPKDVLEVAALKVSQKNGRFELIDTFHRFYYTKYEINHFAYEIHKLSMDVIRQKRIGVSYPELFEDDLEFINFCKNSKTLVAHNIRFELEILDGMVKFENHICTMNKNRHIVKALDKRNRIKNPKLNEVCRYYKIEFDPEKYHSALYDAEKTLEILNSMQLKRPEDLFEPKVYSSLDINDYVFDQTKLNSISCFLCQSKNIKQNKLKVIENQLYVIFYCESCATIFPIELSRIR